MAQLSTPDDAARTVLDMCSESNLRPGDALPLQPFWLRAQQRQTLTSEELGAGVERGVELGWFELADNDRCLLTEAGFSEM